MTNKFAWLIFVFFVIFFINILFEYLNFKDFKYNEVYVANAKVLNIYPKSKYQVVKLQTKKFVFFTSIKANIKLKIYDNIKLYINTSKITFLDYLKGFYTTSFNIHKLPFTQSFKQTLENKIKNQHKNPVIANLFNSLFFATSTIKILKEKCAIFGISHLIAISGFHLSILSFIIYWILYPYSLIQSKYFPYRNKKFDLLIFVSIVLFFYLIFTGVVPSLLRAFIMFVVGIYFLRTNIKLLSFKTLFLVLMIIVSLFPKLLFSLSLWFSISGVFFIFLFFQYFQNYNKILTFFLFNIWIYLAINTISHYFFKTVSLTQLYSPLFTIGFFVFYPVELFLHFIGFGGIFDNFIELWLLSKPFSQEISIPFWFFSSYIFLGLLSVISKKIFILFNIVIISFNLWLYGSLCF